MATISGAADIYTMRLGMADTFNEKVTKVFEVGGAIGDTTLSNLMTDFDLVTNAAFTSANISGTRTIAGLKTSPVDAIERNVSNFVVLTFRRTNPQNVTKFLYKSFTIPAPVDGIIDTLGGVDIVRGVASPTTPQERVGRIVDILEGALVYTNVANVVYVGGWTFVPAMSGSATTANLIDGK